jgi:bacterioferritin-associated ferredoxin
MTRCECAELSFDEVARRMRDQRLSLEALQERTGCGSLCTVCLPDLLDHVASRR